MVEFTRKNHISPTLMILDGISGSGKTIMMRFLELLEGNHLPRFDYSLEQLLISQFYGKIDPDALSTLLSLKVDQLLYDQSISREINLRPNDLSSVFRSAKRHKYLRQLLSSDQEFVFDTNEKKHESVTIVVHQLLSATRVLDKAYFGQIKRILCVRHPYYLFEHWLSYVRNFGENPRDFTVTVGEHGLPWFMNTNSSRVMNLSAEEKTAQFLSRLILMQEEFILRCKNLLTIDFEKFVLGSANYLNEIERYCGKKLVGNFGKILKQERIPRSHINSSRELAIYEKYASKKLGAKYGHKEDYELLRNSIQARISKSSFTRIQKAAEVYESRFGVWF